MIAMLVTASFFYYVWFFVENGYLPSPFLYDKSNTFMDLFNTMYWAYDHGRYTEWGSVYPPLNFILLRILNFVSAGELSGEPEFMRDNSPLVITSFCLVYLAIPVVMLAMRHWRNIPIREKILIYFTIICSPPMLFALERGNLIVLCPVLVTIVLSKIGFVRCVAIALLINLKPYFAIYLLYYIVRGNWKGLITSTALSCFLYALPGLALDNNFIIFLKNILNFSQEQDLFSLREMMSFPASISAFSYILKSQDGAIFASKFIELEKIPFFINMIELVKWSVIFSSIIILIKKSIVMRDSEIFALLAVVITNLGVWVGGYTIIIYISLIPVFIRMRGYLLYILLLTFMVIPLDMIPLINENIGRQYSFLSDLFTNVEWTLGIGSIVRPIINIVLPVIICYEISKRNINLINKCRFTNSLPVFTGGYRGGQGDTWECLR
jgi:hypothetical protein